MADAYFEEHPTDPEKVVLRKPRLDQGPDYERGFVDGMQYQMQSSVDKAVNRMAQPQRTWVGLTDEEKSDIWCQVTNRFFVTEDTHVYADAIEAKLKEKNT